MNGDPTACVCLSTHWLPSPLCGSIKENSSRPGQATPSTHHERGADRSAGKSRLEPGDTEAGVGRQPSPGWSFSSEGQYTVIEMYLGCTIRLALLSPSGSSLGHHRRMAGKSYWDVALIGGLKRAGHATARGCRGAQGTEPPQSPSLGSFTWVYG